MAEVTVHDPATMFRFEVNAGFSAGFSKVGGLRDESEVVEYREGIDPAITRKQPGLRTAAAVTCERGIGPGGEMLAWRNQVRACSGFRRNVTIKVKYCDGSVARVVQVVRAWPSVLQINDLDARTSEVAVEVMELIHEGLQMSAAK